MFDWISGIMDSFRSYFVHNVTASMIIHTFWFMFFVEFPRYYLLEIIIVFWRKVTYKRRRKSKELARMKLYMENPLVTILAPGKNEGENVYKLVCSLAEQTYRNYEIIVVDDGSDDDTPLICRDLEKNGYIDRYLRLEFRGGKAGAANFGMYYARGKYIVHLDADSSLDRNALENILIPFYYGPKVVGVGGCVKVRNGGNSLCAFMQQFEYLKTIQVGRMVTSTIGIYHIISGAFGAFDADAIRNVGCWDIGPGLDGDITQKLRKSGGRVLFADDAICLTNVPEKWFNLFKQRLRWSKSLVRFRLRKHNDILRVDKNFNILNFFSNFDCIFFDCFMNYIWLYYILSLIVKNPGGLLELFIVAWFLRMCFAVIACAIIMLVSERAREEFKICLLIPVHSFYVGYFLRINRLIAHTRELFFFSSYKDAWNPKKTSDIARVEGI